MRLLIRCDASAAIGIGHLMRCVALAERTPATLFAMASGAELAVGRRFSSAAIANDPALFRRFAEEWKPDWIVVDVASADAIIGACAGLGASILRIDDAGLTVPSGAALILNPNTGITRQDYPQDPAERLLLGPHYALLREEFTDRDRPSNSSSRLLVTFGGSDPPNVTQRAVSALARISALAIDVIVGPASLNRAAIEELAADLPNVAIHVHPPHLGQLMAHCDLALTAASGTMWELMAVGTPVLAVAIVEGQKRNLAWLGANGVGRALGWHADVTADAFVGAVTECINDPDLRRTMADRGRALVDGRGANRVLEKMRSVTEEKGGT